MQEQGLIMTKMWRLYPGLREHRLLCLLW